MAQLQRLVIHPHQWVDRHISLTSEQQHYLSRVLRLRQGDRFIAMNGQGQGWVVVLAADLTQAEVLEPIQLRAELPIAVYLLLAMPKNGMDDVIRQVTELGVAQILPIVSQRTVLQPSPQKLERWQRIAQEAAEQSERQVVPEILSPQPWSQALQTWNPSQAYCYVCEARGDYPHLLSCLLNHDLLHPLQQTDLAEAETAGEDSRSENSCSENSRSIIVAIGPEGGWTEAELAAAIEAGYQPVKLGDRVLRAITAPVVALSLVAAAIEAMPGSKSAV